MFERSDLRHRRIAWAPLLVPLVFALIAVGCGRGDDSSTTAGNKGATDTTTAAADAAATTMEPEVVDAPEAESTSTCTAGSYTVSYPASWKQVECRYFDPQEVEEVQPNTDAIPASVEVRLDETAPRQLVESFADPQYGKVLSQGSFSVNGRTTWSAEVEANGQALFPAGMNLYLAAVENGKGKTLAVYAYELQGRDFEAVKLGADAIAESAASK